MVIPILLVSNSLHERGGQTARVVPELSSAGWAVQHAAPAGLADDVTCSRGATSSDVSRDHR